MANCVNKSLPEFQALVSEAGINSNVLAAKIAVWQDKNNKTGVFPTLLELNGLGQFKQVNYTLKAVDVLTSPKAEKVFAKGKKVGWDLNKTLTELQIPKDQKQIILDKGITDREEIVTSLLADNSFTVEVNVAKNDASEMDFNKPEEIGTFKDSSYYSNLTVPGGTNYRENEIATPKITPTIKGHAQFATDKGIGWFRSDERGGNRIDTPYTLTSFEHNGDTFTRELREASGSDYFVSFKNGKEIDNPSTSLQSNEFKKAYEEKLNESNNSKTRRILEVQSDLFQKGRDESNLNKSFQSHNHVFKADGFTYKNPRYGQYFKLDGSKGQFTTPIPVTKEEYESKAPETVSPQKARNQNNFLQLLNKKGNWVNFFIQSIVQDSVKKGYEKVLFPSGNTAAKVEGHESIAVSIANLEKKIDENENTTFENNNWIVEDRADFEETKKNITIGLRKEIEAFKTEGIEKLKPVEAFYTNRVTNILNKLYNVNEITDEHGNTWNEVDLAQEKAQEEIFLQTESKETQEANEEIDQAMSNFLKSIGVKLEAVSEIRDKNGNLIDAVAKADMIKKVVQVVNGKASIDTLPEEAAHFFVELLEADGNPLFDSMMNNIEGYSVYDEVVNDPRYQEAYKGDETKLKKEAVGKLIAQQLVKNLQGNDSPAKMKRAKTWFQRVLDAIKKFFIKASKDPYSRAAYIMLSEKVNDYLNAEENIEKLDEGEYYEMDTKIVDDPRKSIEQKLDETTASYVLAQVSAEKNGIKEKWIVEPGSDLLERYIGMPGTPFEGVVIRGRVSDEVKKYFHKMQNAKKPETAEQEERRISTANIRMQTGVAGHKTLEDLINLQTNKKGTRAQILANSPFNAAQFSILEKGVKNLLSETKKTQDKINKENGTKGDAIIKTEQLVINGETGGTIDLLVLYNDGSAAVYDWKFVSPSKEGGYVKGNKIINDPFSVKMDTYNIQIGSYKQTLLNEYGVTKVRQSRIVPIHIRFGYNQKTKRSTNQITLIQMGVQFSEFLAQIPVAEEMTDFEKINDLITKLISRKKKVEERLRNKNFQIGETFEKAKLAKETMEKQLRKLQLNQDIAYVLNGLKKDLDGIEKKIEGNDPLTEKGDPNPFYLSLDELNDLNNDLIFYKNLLQVPKYMSSLEKEDPEAHAKTIALQQEVGRIIVNAQSMVVMKIKERVTESAEKRGIKGIDSYNPGIDYMTGAFVTLSKQNNPYLRNLWGIVNELNYGRRKASKVVAAEIQRLQDAVLAQSSTPNSVKAFAPLINKETGNFVAKFQKEYYEQRDEALQRGDSKWMKENTIINKEGYERKFKEYRKNKEKMLKQKHKENTKAISRDLLIWDKQHDVVNHFKTASISLGGKYFLKADEKWISSEYLSIQANPALKEFYEYYQDKIRVIEEMFGMTLGPGFIANLQKEFIEHAQNGDFKKGIDSMLEGIQLREHDLSMGQTDDNTGKLIRTIPQLYVRPIVDGNGNIDSSLKSRDLGKGLLLLFNTALDYKMKMDVLPEVTAMEQLLKNNEVKETDTDMLGNVIPTLSGITKKLFETRNNSDIFTGYVDQYFFGSVVKAKDFKIGKYSGLKTALALKRHHSLMSLGLKMPVAAGAFFAGQFGLYQQAAKNRFITTKSLKTSQAALMKGDPSMRALAEYFDMYQRDDTENRADKLSANYVKRHMTNDKWFTFLSTADRGIDATITHSVAQTMGLDPATNRIERLTKLPEGTKSILELMERKLNPQWEGTAGNVSNKAVDKYIVSFPGMSEAQEIEFRDVAKRVSDKVKGTMTSEDISLYNNTLLMKFMMHYKSWLPGVAMERFGKQRYDHILRTFDEGTWISTWNNLAISKIMGPAEALDKEVSMLEYGMHIGKDIINIGLDVVTFGLTDQFKIREDLARAKFEQWVANNKDNPEFTERLKDPEQKEEMFKDFVDMKRGNIKANLMEVRLSLLFFLLLMLMGGDYDDDGKADIRQSRAGRKLYAIVNRTYREIAVFTQPQEFLESGRATGIPLLSFGQLLINGFSNTADEIRDNLIGENNNRDKTDLGHYAFKMVPVLSALTKAVEMRESDKNART